MITLLVGGLLGASLGIALTVLSMMWRDQRPQYQADACENAAIQRYVHHSVWV